MAIVMRLCPSCGTIQKEGTICPLCKCPVDDRGRALVEIGRLGQGIIDAVYAMANMEIEFPEKFQELPGTTDKSDVPF
jgi:hypothetical protein